MGAMTAQLKPDKSNVLLKIKLFRYETNIIIYKNYRCNLLYILSNCTLLKYLIKQRFLLKLTFSKECLQERSIDFNEERAENIVIALVQKYIYFFLASAV